MITIGQAARLLGISVDTLRNWDKSGKLSAIKDEKGQRWYSSEIIEKARSEGVLDEEKEKELICYGLRKKDLIRDFNSALESFKDNDYVDVRFFQRKGYPTVCINVQGVDEIKYAGTAFRIEGAKIIEYRRNDEDFSENMSLNDCFERELKLDSQSEFEKLFISALKYSKQRKATHEEKEQCHETYMKFHKS